MTAMEQEPKKKATKKAATAESAAEPALHVVETLKPDAKPGQFGFDWQTEYPGEEIWVYTTIDEKLTIGLAKLGPNRKPKPGLLRRLHREGGMSVMWYFLELASSDTSLRLQEELDDADYNKMLRGWCEFTGIELSE